MATSLEMWEVVAPLAARSLDDAHREVLEVGSNISPEIIKARGYYSLTEWQMKELFRLEILGPDALRAESWMGIPIWRPDGRKHGEVIRLFGGDSPMKYVWPTGLRLAFDVHPSCLDLVHRTDVDVLFTEGIKKGDAILTAAQDEGIPLLVISLNGCYGWRTKLENGSSIASPDFLDISLEDRRAYINSDSDYRTNNGVSSGWNRCATYVSSKTGEHRTLLVVTPPSGLEKQGADDWLAGGGTLGDLLGTASTPERALSDDSGVRKPLALKSGMRLIRDSGDKIPHMIAPLIPEQSITLVAGHSGTYKTWHMAGLALDGGFGLPWLAHPGLTMEYGPFTTLYVNKEMSGIILGQRLKTLALNERYTTTLDHETVIEDRLVFTHDSELDISKQEQRDRLEDAIILSGAKLVVLDSLSMSWHGDENSSTEVGDLYAALRGIIERTGCCFVLLHHLLKPPGGRPSKTPVVSQFAIRGSGQLYQQADACLMLDLYATHSPLQDPDEVLVVIHHLKARTSRQIPSWLVKFKTNDGLFTSMEYMAGLAEAKARVYSESGGDSTKMQDWIMEECYGMPAMQPGPGNPGFRSTQLFLMLQQAWKVEGKSAPSDATLARHLGGLVDQGRIVVIEESRKFGHLYQLADETLPEDETIVEVAPSS